MKAILAAVSAAVLLIIAGTIWIGARVREDTVVANPYEEGLKLNRPAGAAASPGAHHAGEGPGLELTLEPRPLRTMRELVVSVAAPSADAVTVSFAMAGMDMGDDTVRLARGADGVFRGKAVLVRCPSGRKDWIATVRAQGPSGAVQREVAFRVEE